MNISETYLIVFAPVYGPSGYAKLARSFILGLDKLGVKIKLEPNRLWEPHETVLPPAVKRRLNELERTPIPKNCQPPKMSIGIAPWFDKAYPGYKIGYSMFEFDNVPNFGKYDWKASCLKMDEVWVPSTYNLRTFNENGINNVHVVAPGIDINEFNPNVEALIQKDDRVRFLAVGEYTPRKGWDLLIPAYLAEFSSHEKVSLIIKSYNGSRKVDDSKKWIKQDILRYRNESANKLHPHILFIGDILSNEKLPNLYKSADVFTLLTRGEGFGLPMAEAMACGLPCVLPANSSYLDFIDDSNGYLVGVNGLEDYESLHKASVLYRDSKSPVIDVMHARRILREIFEDVKSAKAKGVKARSDIVAEFSVEQAAKRMLNRLHQIESYWKPQVINLVTDNFEELVLDEEDTVETPVSETLNVSVVRKKDNVGTVAMLAPSWGDNCGVADYCKKLVERLRSKKNTVIVKNLFNLVDTVQRQGIHLVHIQHHYSFYSPVKLKEVIEKLKSLGVKVVITVHDYCLDQKMRAHDECFALCDRIIVHSNLIKGSMVSRGIDKYKINTILMGCDPAYSQDKAQAKRNLRMENKTIISSFGFLQPHKNWLEVVKAIPTIKKQVPDVTYLLMSVLRDKRGVASQYDGIIDTTIQRLGIGNHVKRFKNFLSEERVLQMLAASDAIILPYNNYKVNGMEYQACSISSRFAMRVQRPVVVSDASFFSDVQEVAHVTAVNPLVIARNVVSIVKDQNLQRKIVLRQFNFCNTHTWERFRDRLAEIYTELGKQP